MAKSIKKASAKMAPAAEKPVAKKPATKKATTKKPTTKKLTVKKAVRALLPANLMLGAMATAENSGVQVLDRLFATIAGRKGADPSVSHSARLLSRGTGKVAQKFGEEAVECLIEAVAGNRTALIAESADVLYHLLVLWVDAGVLPHEVWGELERRQGVSGIAEKAARAQKLSMAFGLATNKIP